MTKPNFRIQGNQTGTVTYETAIEHLTYLTISNETGIEPKSVIRHAESVSDWENEAFGHLARFCPHPVSRYAST